MYTGNNSAIAKSAEKLSSGYRVNRAGDDAAGLAISEKMRAQVRGLSMASKNSSDAISMVQTAEGALQEVHSMLQRMNELAVQAASDTNVTIDRDALQLEFQNLQQEIDQISQTTKFNDTVLLDGSLGSGAATPGGPTFTATETTALSGAAPSTETNTVGAITATFDAGMAGNALAGMIKDEAGAGDYTFSFEVDANDTNKVNLVATHKTDNTLDPIVVGTADFTGKTAPAVGGNAEVVEITSADGQKLGELSVAAATGGNTGGGNGAAIATEAAKITVNGEVNIAAGAGAAKAAAAGADPIAADDIAATANKHGGISFTFSDADIKAAIEAAGLEAGEYTLSMQVKGGATDTVELVATSADGTATVLGEGQMAAADAANDVSNQITDANGNVLVTADVGPDAAGQATADEIATAVAGATFTNATINTAADNNNATAGNAAVIQVGAEEGHTLNISIEAITTAGLGLAEGTVKINGATAADARENASKAITATRAAINQVSTQRAQLGAMQNRLEYKINNLDTTTENLQAAESRIRDTDMAKEMSEFTKNNILSQAATAMLAQANAAPQNVLQLLG